MTVKTVHCDKCGKTGAQTVLYDFTRGDCTAGVTEYFKTIDLCHEHATERLQAMLGTRLIYWASEQKATELRKAFTVYAANKTWKGPVTA